MDFNKKLDLLISLGKETGKLQIEDVAHYFEKDSEEYRTVIWELEHKGIEIALANVRARVEYVNYDEKKKQATYVRYPQRSELNAEINESLIVEYYSRV